MATRKPADKLRWCDMDKYPWRCACGEPGWVLAFEGDTPCLACWTERRRNVHRKEVGMTY